VAESGGLENRCAGNRTVGSNPTPSVDAPYANPLGYLLAPATPRWSYPSVMAVAHAEPPLSLPDPGRVDPSLRLAFAERAHGGDLGRDGVDGARLARLVEAPIVLGIRDPESFRAQVIARSGSEEASLIAYADLAMREAGGERAVVLRCTASTLTVALITVLDPVSGLRRSSDEAPLPVLHWTLKGTSADATARADILDFLRVLHRGGQLRIIAMDRGQSVGTLEVPSAPFDAELDRDLAFVGDVATLEEWAGMVLPLPVEVSAAEVARIAQAAAMVRAREVPVAFTADIAVTVPRGVAGAEEIELEQDFGVTVFGYEVPLGLGRVRLPISMAEVESAAEDPELVHATLHPAAADVVVFALSPPPERTPYKRTLLPDEQIAPDLDPPWSSEWIVGEQEASRELRSGDGIRFVSEGAFFDWLAHPDDGAPG
jgi:hypothetical protein